MSRKYPQWPVPAASALVYQGGNILLVQRRSEPGAGKWSLPGGKIELGETAENAAVREVHEECHVQVQIQKLFNAVDVIFHDDSQQVLYHYIILVYLAGYVSGTPEISPETLDVRWVPPARALEEYDLTGTTRATITAFTENIQ